LTRKIINQQTNRKNKMKTKVISKFGIIFAGALTMVTTAVFTACNSEDDFGGDISGEYSLATRMMTQSMEGGMSVNDTTIYNFGMTLSSIDSGHGFDASVYVEFRYDLGKLEVELIEYQAPPLCTISSVSLTPHTFKGHYFLAAEGYCEDGVLCNGKNGTFVHYSKP